MTASPSRVHMRKRFHTKKKSALLAMHKYSYRRRRYITGFLIFLFVSANFLRRYLRTGTTLEDFPVSQSDNIAMPELLNSRKAKVLQSNPTSNKMFLLFRAIGNAIPYRHSSDQTIRNLLFILNNENKSDHVDRRWYINRIVDPALELQIIKLLISRDEFFVREPFPFDEFSRTSFALDRGSLFESRDAFYRRSDANVRAGLMLYEKNQVLTAVNYARNKMLEIGKESGAEYIMPLDGNCFMHDNAWKRIIPRIKSFKGKYYRHVSKLYFSLKMVRVTSNDILLNPHYVPLSAEEEPQVIFHRDSVELFNESMPYGFRSKVELLWRLGIRGNWDNFAPGVGPWKEDRTKRASDLKSTETVEQLRFVARLQSGMENLETAHKEQARGVARTKGLYKLICESSAEVLVKKYNFTKETLLYYSEEALRKAKTKFEEQSDTSLLKLVSHLMNLAESEYRNTRVYSVTDKLKTPPSGSKHDYLSIAPYFWPNNETEDGIPYEFRDGMRNPGSVLYSQEGENYDRTRIADFTRNVTILTLAGFVLSTPKYMEKAATMIKTWFLNNETRMNPNLNFSQIRYQTQTDTGSSSGILDFVEISTVLDMIKLLFKEKFLNQEEMTELRNWCKHYLSFLLESNQGMIEVHAQNNHGTLYDVQIFSLSAFVGDFENMIWHGEISKLRMVDQFSDEGSMPREMIRQTQLHYMMYGLQAWVWLAKITKTFKGGFSEFRNLNTKEEYLKKGFQFLLPYLSTKSWNHKDSKTEDMNRMVYLFFQARKMYPDIPYFAQRVATEEHVISLPENVYDASPIFSSLDLVPVFWNLGL